MPLHQIRFCEIGINFGCRLAVVGGQVNVVLVEAEKSIDLVPRVKTLAVDCID